MREFFAEYFKYLGPREHFTATCISLLIFALLLGISYVFRTRREDGPSGNKGWALFKKYLHNIGIAWLALTVVMFVGYFVISFSIFSIVYWIVIKQVYWLAILLALLLGMYYRTRRSRK